MLTVQRATCPSQVQRHGAAVSLPAGLKRSPFLSRRHTQPMTTQRLSRTAVVRPCALFYPSGGSKNLNRIAAAPPQARQALLSSAISSCRNWRQLGSLVEAYGPYLSTNNISHCLTRLEQVLAAQQLTAGEAEQVEVLLEWLLRRGREMNATAQLGPQALGATAGALARLQGAQRQRQQQEQLASQQQQQQQQARSVRQRVLEEEEAKRAAAVADRRQSMQQLVDAAVAQRSRLSPQALNDILSGIASIDKSGMSADEIRQLLNIPTQQQPRSRQAAAPAAAPPARPASSAEQQAQQLQQRQQPQQQRVVGPDELQRTARQLGQLSPELAQEWHDRALRQCLNQGTLPAGVDQRYLSGFLAREIDRAAERARETTSSSRGRAAAPSGAALLQAVLVRYGLLLGVAHLALAGHRLAELQQEGLAGAEQEVEAIASRLFQLSQARMSTADAAGLSSLISSCKELRLYSESMLSAALARAKSLLQQQLQGGPGFSVRQLGVVLHSLAVLGLKPSDAWLRLAVMAAGQLLPSCSLTDLERLASSLVLMRTAPGREWTAAAEAQLEQLAAAIGSSAADSARARALIGDDGDVAGEEEEEEEAVDAAASNARKALVACVKSLALLGGPRATGWYRNIVAVEEQRKRQQEQEEQQERLRQQREAAAAKQQQLLQQQQQQQRQLRQRRRREIEQERQRQQEQLQQRQTPAATSEDLLKRQLRKAMAQQQRGRSQQPLSQHQQHKHQAAANSSSGVSNNRELTALSSLDDMMSRALQEPEVSSSSSSRNVNESTLPHATTSIAEATGISGSSSSELGSGASTLAIGKPSSSSSSSSSSTVSGKKAGKHSSAPSRVEAAAPAVWAAEQAARWADTEGEQSPAAELQQQLDDSKQLFGAGRSRDSRQQQQRQQQANKQVEAGNADAALEIEVDFGGAASQAKSSSSKGGQPQPQPQRSAADAASALAAMMAEVDQQEVDESAQQEVLRELGLGPDGRARLEGQAAGDGNDDGEGVLSLQDIQAAAEAVQQATQQLNELEQHQQQAAAEQQQQEQQEQPHTRLQKKHRKHKQEAAAPAAAAAAAKRRPLGSSGEAAFVAAAKNLSSGRPSRNYLLGCLEAIEMQQQQLKQQLAEKQALAAVAGAAQRQRAAVALDANPLARKIAQLQQDFENARKRAADEKASVTATTVADVASKLLPLLDSFDAALAAQQQLQQQGQAGDAAREAEKIHTVYTGLHNQLLSFLKSQGVTVIGENDDVVGQAFDPNHMEAVMRQPAPAGFADGDVLRVLRKGYAVGERLVRPALVVVAYED